MDDLNSPFVELSKSTFSLQEKYSFESGLESKGSSSTIVVTPVLESRVNHAPATLAVEGDAKMKVDKEEKELKKDIEEKNEEVNNEDMDEVDFGDEIVPVEKETMFSYRTLLHSNLGYIDKLSAISEVSAESGFDDRTDVGKFSERSESVASDESLSRNVGINIDEHIQHINSMDLKKENNADVREKTAKSKKEWLESILKEEAEPYFLQMEKEQEESENEILGKTYVDILEQPTIHITKKDNIYLTKPENPIQEEKIVHITSKINHVEPNNHSVLLGILRENKSNEFENKIPQIVHEGESIFLTNTKTNIIYKSLSSDNLKDEDEYRDKKNGNILTYRTDLKEDNLNSKCKITVTSESNNPFNVSTSNIPSDSLIERSKFTNVDSTSFSSPDDKNCNLVSPFEFKEVKKSQLFVSTVTDLQPSEVKQPKTSFTDIIVNDHSVIQYPNRFGNKEHDNKLSVKEPSNKGSTTSSRRSSLTDSLQEFEISIYDMLKESEKYHDSSDEEESIKTTKAGQRH